MPTIRTKSGGTRQKATGKSGTHTRSGASRESGHKVSTSSSGKETQVATGMTAIKEEIAANKKKLPEEMTHGAGTILQYDPYKSGSVSSQIALRQRTGEAGRGNKLAQQELKKYKETGDISVITGATKQKVFSKLELEARKRARAKAPKLEAYKYSLDKEGNIIQPMESKTGRFGVRGIGRKDVTGNWASYLSSKQVQRQNTTIKYATTGIHKNTNARDRKRILEARKAYLNQIPTSGKAETKAYFIQQDLNANLARKLGYKNPLTNEQSGKVIAYMDKIKKYPPEKQAQLMATKFNKPNITEDVISSVNNVVNKANAILAKGMLPNLIKPYVDKADAKLSEGKRYSELKEKTISGVEGSKYLAPAAKLGKGAYESITTKPINTAATMGELYVLGGSAGLVVGAGKVALKTGIKKAAIATGSKAVIEASPKVAMAASTGLDIGIAIPLVGEFASKDIEGKYKLLGELAIGGKGYKSGARYAESKLLSSGKVVSNITKATKTTKPKVTKPKIQPAIKKTQPTKPVKFKPKSARPIKQKSTVKKPIKVSGEDIPIEQLEKLGTKDALKMLEMKQAQQLDNFVLTDILKTPTRKTKGLSDQAILRIKNDPILEMVEYKGKLFTVPKSLRGVKRELYLKRMYEGKPIRATPEEIARGKLSRRQLKEKVKASEISGKLQELLNDESAQLLRPKNKEVSAIIKEVKSEHARPFKKNGYINNTKVEYNTYTKAQKYYRSKPEERLTAKEIQAVKRSIRAKIKPIRKSKFKIELEKLIRLYPIVDIRSLIDVTEKVDTAVAIAQAQALKSVQETKPKTKIVKGLIGRGRKTTKPTIKQLTTKETRPKRPIKKSTSKSTKPRTEIKPMIPIPEYKIKKVGEDAGEIASFERAYRIHKTKLGTLGSVLGGGNNKKPATKRRKPAKTTRKTRRKVSA